ncbi:hypothetical protein GCM10011575_12210 [Microlunatus endophyticus]|uniref:Uncharacterized protein n=1 Tax=Microlunatus endophyticus TaxID=1716077 RepID=A0A917W1A2_9ACTN|nr:hypothetical protein GCM10011575_12210 [Microlunatus endophyticus]
MRDPYAVVTPAGAVMITGPQFGPGELAVEHVPIGERGLGSVGAGRRLGADGEPYRGADADAEHGPAR